MKTSTTTSDKKHIEELSKTIENMRKLPHNKQCFDCGEKGTTYVVLDFGTFICSNCSGIHRELNYKVKGLGVSNFNDKEVAFLQKNGNEEAKKYWLANFDSVKNKLPDPKDSVAVKNFIKAKYQEKKYIAKQEKEKKKEKEKEKEKEKKDTKKKEKEESESSESSPEKDKKKNQKKTEKLVPLNVKKSDKDVKETKQSETENKGGPQLKKINLGKTTNVNSEEKEKQTKKEDINEMLDNFEFFEDSQTDNNNNNHNNTNVFNNHNNVSKQQSNPVISNPNNNIDINSIFNNNIFESAPQQTNPLINNPTVNNGNNINNFPVNQPQPQNQQKKVDLNIDQLYGQYNQPQPGYPGYQQQQFNPMNPMFNPQMNQQMNPQMNPQLNPQMMNMIMSNPQLFYQLMQQLQQQQNQGGFQQNQGGFQQNLGINTGLFNAPSQMNPNFPTMVTPQVEAKTNEDEKKDLFKDIYSYSENKKKNPPQTTQKVENNYNPFI